MQDKQGEGSLPAQVPRVIVAPCCKAGLRPPHGDAEKNGHTARKGGQNLAYRPRTAPLLSLLPLRAGPAIPQN